MIIHFVLYQEMFLQFVPFERIIFCRSEKVKINKTIERKENNKMLFPNLKRSLFVLKLLILTIEEARIEQM